MQDTSDQESQMPNRLNSHNRKLYIILSISVILNFGFLIIISALISAYFGSISKIYQITTEPDMPPITQKLKPSPTIPKIDDKDRIIHKKDYENISFGAFAVEDTHYPWSIFQVSEINGDRSPFSSDVVSTAYHDFSQDKLFDISNDVLYVINAARNVIDVYSVEESYTFKYTDSIELPKYKIGIIYSIECTDIICDISSALHQESGCDMEYNIKLKKFNTPSCSEGIDAHSFYTEIPAKIE